MAARFRLGHALAAVRLGRPAVFAADGEGVLVLAAEAATPSRIAFSSGTRRDSSPSR